MLVNVVLEMQNYIAHPFWPATNTCIDIEKKSGVNRQKSEEKRVAALKAECTKRGMTYEEYLALKEESKKQFYTRGDGTIYIPRHQLAGALVQTIGQAPKALRGPYTKDNFRSQVVFGDFDTELMEDDANTWGRFVKLEGSNQRSWQENDYIGQYLDKGKPFTATGAVEVKDPKQGDTVKALLIAAVETIGIGAARKMGWGRGRIAQFDTNGEM